MTQENQRVRLTKRLLKDSLMAMLKTESIYAISIRELCENAGINRSTFYKHYGSQFEVLAEMEKEVLMGIEAELTDKKNALKDRSSTSQDNLTRIIQFIDQNLELFKMLVNSNVDPEFPVKLLYLPIIKAQLENLMPENHAKVDPNYYYDFIVYGGYSILQRWINKEQREAPEEMARTMLQIFNNLIDLSD
ncbi:TetR/AcrR family transcriptional regulator C-terminal domain-containing protein [Fusibacter paucivorans]|uniref:TetR/AcrR family transcriptional regulator C-terminal domain-containing protein n=1 Tax=Fusibacter paucivorans TaxID=76009 RepID=A0ABS5PPB2_9FIRM|nr:TetR-like C-terminal domain-containing protein [Fusibacter paucivorans]MBS7526886.1 TetR/AcrR family transcriptional regulator C-terminal domain-containing protein [Fusibacter paucivorans]